MVNCKVSDLNILWKSFRMETSDFMLLQQRRVIQNPQLILNEKQQEFFALAEIHKLLKSIGKSLKDFNQLPQPPSSYLDFSANNLIIEETRYDQSEMEKQYEELIANCNPEQLSVYKSVMESVEKNEGGVFFVYGSGGCGKTYLWRTLISKLRSERKIVIPVASSGIAATLMPGGRTAHSRFKIPIVLDDHSMCSISHQSDIAELIKRTSLIIWDEAPMQHRYSFECLDRSLRDIMKAVDPNRFHLPFGGITVVLGGDFRQILPVIPRGSEGEIVSSCITRSKLWKIATVFKLYQNMRLNKGTNEEEVQNLRDFAKWVLDVGDGKIKPPTAGDREYHDDDISIPEHFCNLENSNSVDEMIDSTFPDFLKNFKDPEYLSERAILTPTNQIVGHVNTLIVEKIPGEMHSYYSVDSAEDFPGSERDQMQSFPPEYMNSLNVPGLPLHELKLKVGTVVMLMRNLNQTLGLCNGTRMMVTKCLKHCVQCEVISGSYKGTKHFIPRMELSPSETRLPFRLCRKQMPLQICYAMTINKSQGQSLEKVALFLPKPVFTHGQLYVAISRVTSPQGLKLFINDEEGNTTNIIANVVYRQIFYNLPVI
nr:PREDICTED: ATP-dependent DNA helicase PIF1-like [Daucus carota subsp. sativus]